MASATDNGESPAEGMEPLARFGYNLLRIRQARKLSQEALADRAGVHRTEISLFENGRRQPLLETLTKLAGALDVPVGMLTEGITFTSRPGGGELRATRPPELPRVSERDGHGRIERRSV
jgi:transcriptional regulator with XRE-family HTH domain